MIGSSLMVVVSLASHPSCPRSAHRDCRLRRLCPCLNRMQSRFDSAASCFSSSSHASASSPAQHRQSTAVDAEALLKRSDTFRNGWPAYVLKVKITNYESDKSDEEKLYTVSQKGTDKTYVEFMSPRDKGRHLLMLGDDMWIYLPDTSRPIRITPLERLSGDASNGDVARTNYAVDYSAVYLRTEKLGSEQCFVLELTARRKGATYQRILYWLRAEDARPVRAEFYLTSGKHIKSATFDDYAPSAARCCSAG